MTFLPEGEYNFLAKRPGFSAADIKENAPGTRDSCGAEFIPSGSNEWEEAMDQFERHNKYLLDEGLYWKQPVFPIGPRGGQKPLSDSDLKRVQERFPTFKALEQFLRSMLAFLGSRLPDLMKNESEVDFDRLIVTVRAFGTEQGLPAGVSEQIFRRFSSSVRYLRTFGDLEL